MNSPVSMVDHLARARSLGRDEALYPSEPLAHPPRPRGLPRPDINRPPLGQMLVEAGAITEEDLAFALRQQTQVEARLGDILLFNGMVAQETLYKVLANRFNTLVADLKADPPDVRLIDEIGAQTCIRLSIVPWKRIGGRLVLICSHPDDLDKIVAQLPPQPRPPRLAVAPEADIQAALVAMRHRDLASFAESRVDEDISCRNWNPRSAGRLGLGLFLGIVAMFVISPALAFAVLTGWAVLTLAINSGIKLVAAAMYLRKLRANEPPRPVDKVASTGRLPVVSILLPLYKEREIAGRLVDRVGKLDYPRELLDICLIVEADDTMTQETLDKSELPLWMRRITVPEGSVRTKPRAMNFALDFCRGSIIGIYDAEDAPEPDQIYKIVNRFAEAGPWVACLQGILDFYNASTNWLSRAFTVEYATWFRIVLPGMEKMGFAVPLGGTTVFFRRAALEALGGWDAHNVTEDADLGIRLARRGFRTELIQTVTYEEANCRWWPWVKQRSRWIKGYAMTYGVHMRRPGQLFADLGMRKFLGVQFLFLGTLSQFALAPFLWSFWLVLFGLPHPLVDAMPTWSFVVLGTLFLATELLTISVGILSVNRDGRKFLRKWVPTLHFYFPLASLAAAKGLTEIITTPFYWDKTEHGIADETREALAALAQTGSAEPSQTETITPPQGPA